jgi:hypothetical protein
MYVGSRTLQLLISGVKWKFLIVPNTDVLSGKFLVLLSYAVTYYFWLSLWWPYQFLPEPVLNIRFFGSIGGSN